MPLTISLQGQVGLVTGAGTPHGIGRSMVLALADAGAKVVYACDLNISAIPSLQEEISATGSTCKVEARLLDVSEEQSTVSLLKEIVKKEGRFDFYFANAGFANYRVLEDLESIHWNRAINVMTTSAFYAIKHGSKAMMVTSAEKPTPGGNIILTSSCAAYLGGFADLAYTASKTAVNGLVMAGSVQLASSNIRVNGVAPGFTKTSILTSSSVSEKGAEYKLDQTVEQLKDNHAWFFERAGLLVKPEYYFNRQAEAEEMANVAVFLASNLAAGINGQIILADSGKVAGATGETTTGPIPPVKPLDLAEDPASRSK